MKKIYLIVFTLMISFNHSFAQLNDSQIGSANFESRNQQGNLFDYSDPQAINIKVSVWGYVRSPGKYIIPIYTTLIDLLSYAGGPSEGAELDDLRIYRVLEDGTQQMFKFDYNDLMNEDNLSSRIKAVPDLKASDVLVIPGAPKLYFQDWLGISLNVLSAIFSITLFILSVAK